MTVGAGMAVGVMYDGGGPGMAARRMGLACRGAWIPASAGMKVGAGMAVGVMYDGWGPGMAA